MNDEVKKEKKRGRPGETNLEHPCCKLVLGLKDEWNTNARHAFIIEFPSCPIIHVFAP